MKFIAEECEIQVTDRLKQIENLKQAKFDLDKTNQDLLTTKRKLNATMLAQNVKNNERMKKEINKRI